MNVTIHLFLWFEKIDRNYNLENILWKYKMQRENSYIVRIDEIWRNCYVICNTARQNVR